MPKFHVMHVTKQGLSAVEDKMVEAPSAESAAEMVGSLYSPEAGVAFQDRDGVGYYVPSENLGHVEILPEEFELEEE